MWVKESHLINEIAPQSTFLGVLILDGSRRNMFCQKADTHIWTSNHQTKLVYNCRSLEYWVCVYTILKCPIKQLSENSERPCKSYFLFEFCCYGQRFITGSKPELWYDFKKVSYSVWASVWYLEHSRVSQGIHRIVRSFYHSNTLKVAEYSREDYAKSRDKDQCQNIKDIHILLLRGQRGT